MQCKVNIIMMHRVLFSDEITTAYGSCGMDFCEKATLYSSAGSLDLNLIKLIRDYICRRIQCYAIIPAKEELSEPTIVEWLTITCGTTQYLVNSVFSSFAFIPATRVRNFLPHNTVVHRLLGECRLYWFSITY